QPFVRPPSEATTLANALVNRTVSIAEALPEPVNQRTRLLLIVDQWEELYTEPEAETEARRFIEEVLSATASRKLTLVLTMRADFLGRALANRTLAARLNEPQITLGPMTRSELERAIRVPAEKVNLQFEAGLIDRILDDVGDEPGKLPLL